VELTNTSTPTVFAMMPKQGEIEIPLLRLLEELGGQAKPADIYQRISKFFPDLSEADLAETLPSGGNKWTNRIQWVRQRLVSKGEMASPGHGIWAITEKGRARLSPAGASSNRESVRIQHFQGSTQDYITSNFEELAEEYLEAFTSKVLQKLQDLTPQQFERFAGVLLAAYGFVEVKVTGRSGDGGIDGHGKLKVGLATMNVAFQCKRWQAPVGRPEVDKFRGAIQGEFEQGILFTPSDFSTQAREASIKKGAVPIVLINGEAIVQLMIDKGIGVKRQPVEIYEDQIDSLFEDS
jgi:restriction system protein